jgi:hypothetical protein
MSDPKTVKVLARDVVPYLYGFWSSVAGGDPRTASTCGSDWRPTTP